VLGRLGTRVRWLASSSYPHARTGARATATANSTRAVGQHRSPQQVRGASAYVLLPVLIWFGTRRRLAVRGWGRVSTLRTFCRASFRYEILVRQKLIKVVLGNRFTAASVLKNKKKKQKLDLRGDSHPHQKSVWVCVVHSGHHYSNLICCLFFGSTVNSIMTKHPKFDT
jgi:hypothetical protein